MMNNDFNRLSLDPEKRRQAEILKDLMMRRKPSRWPFILAGVVVLAILAAAYFWVYLPPEKRPPLDILKNRIVSLGGSLLNAPIVSTPASLPATSQPGGVQSSTAPTPASDTGLLSK